MNIILENIEEEKERTKFFQLTDISESLYIYTDCISLLVKKNALKVKFNGNKNSNNPNLTVNKL